MRIHVCGTRGSTQAPGPDFVRYGGHTSCVAVAHDGEVPSLILDAGTGIRRVWSLLDGRPFDGSVLLGHLHWDHTHGLPFFAAGDHPGSRVDVYLPEQGEDPVELLSRGFSPPHFPIAPTQLRGAWTFSALEEGTVELEGFEVLAREIPHKGGRTFGFRVSDDTGTVAYLSDHHPASYGPGDHGWGPYHEAALALCGGADVLLHDAQYVTEDWPTRGAFGHSTVDYAVGLAEAAGVGRLLLYHHDPARTDAQIDAILAGLGGVSVDVSAAAEGLTVTVASGVTELPDEAARLGR